MTDLLNKSLGVASYNRKLAKKFKQIDNPVKMEPIIGKMLNLKNIWLFEDLLLAFGHWSVVVALVSVCWPTNQEEVVASELGFLLLFLSYVAVR